MGVFDSIRDKLGDEESSDSDATADGETASAGGSDTGATDGGDAAGSTSEDAASNAPGDAPDAAADGGADESPDPADDAQSHANHWSALVPPDDREEEVPELIETTVDEGEAVEGEPVEDGDVLAHRRQDGALGTITVAVDQEVITAYPVADGVEQTIDVEQVGGWASGVEAWIVGESGPASLTSFATNFFELDREALDREFDAEVAVFMYNVGEAEADSIEVDGEEVDVSSFAGFRPWDAGAPDDAVVRTTVEEVERVSLDDWGAYRIEAPLFRQEDEETGEEERVDAAFYVADHVAGDYEPEPGDAIEGAAWIQAEFE